MPRTLVTSALPYANGPIHLGHLAGAYLPADFYVRYLRLKGEDVVYICGSDEQGVAIMMRAHAEGRTPREVVDEFHPVIERGLRAAGMSFDHYGRTSSATHHETAAELFQDLADKGVFRLKTDQQLYDADAGVFLADRFVRGTCPVCGYADAYGDQCENCGSSLSPSELIGPRSAISNTVPELRETTHWYLPLGDVQPRLEAWLETASKDWKPNVTGQVRSWLADGLRDRAMTRDLAWGIPVPERAAREAGVDAAGKVLYVWFDAPIGYLSATKEWAAQVKDDPEAWRPYWQDEQTRLVHFIGKDNIVFHCLTFPAVLMLHGGFVLPWAVPANEFLNLEGRKFSTSRNWAIWLHEFMERFPADLVRYALGATLPETKDADFSLKDFQARVNGELADVLGNFVHRAMTFAHRYFDGTVPAPALAPADAAVLETLAHAPGHIGEAYRAFTFRDAIFRTLDVARMGNKYFNDAAPWHQVKTDPAAAATTIYTSLQLCASLSVLLEPIIPDAAARLRAMLNLEGVRPSTPGGTGALGWDDAARPLLAPGHRLGTPAVLFAKLDDAVIQAELDRLHASAPATAAEEHAALVAALETSAGDADGDALGESPETSPEAPFLPLGETIQYDDFARLDLRVGRVTVAERVPKADKLLRLEVDLGFETRQILSGIAEQYAPEDLVGKQVVIVANLAPRKLRGFESQGMILLAEDRAGRLAFVSTDAEPGSVVK